MRLSLELVEHAQVPAQLPEVGGLELATLELDSNEAVEVAVEEQQVDELVLAESLKMVSVADEREAPARTP